ncbi:MAG: DUF3772 domain-containing protein [Rhodospirillaceae bacterium]
MKLFRLDRLLQIIALLLLPVLWGPAAAVAGSSVDEAAFAARVTGWQKVLDKAGSSLVRPNLSVADYEAIHQALSTVFDQAHMTGSEAAEGVTASRQLLEALGKAPAEGAPAEADSVTTEREHLEADLSRFDGRVRQSELVATRADMLLRTANERRINQFAETLFLRGVSPLAPDTLRQVPAEAQFLRDRVMAAIAVVHNTGLPTRENLIQFGLLAALALISGWFGRRYLISRFGQNLTVTTPSYRERVVAAVAEGFARGLIPSLLTMAAAWVALEALNGLPQVAVLKSAIRSLAGAVVAFFLIAGFSRAMLATRKPAWRVFGLDHHAAVLMSVGVTLFALGFAVSGAVLAFLEVALVPPELHAVTGFCAKVLGSVSLLAMLPPRLWRAGTSVAPRSLAPGYRALAAVVAVSVVALAVLRYHNLGYYVGEMFLAGTMIAGILFLLRGVGLELVSMMVEPSGDSSDQVQRAIFHSERDIRVFRFLAGALIDFLLVVLGLALLLPLSGIAWSEVMAWGSLFLRGFRIGEVTLSPIDIVSALLLVTVIMGFTRFLQRVLDDRVLQNLQIDRGVRHSIRTGIGYGGALIAILVGVSTVGLNLSNLALIAGALSVGIGFGLQAIVGNFVAGLILLVERPIKVGDWIVIGEHEGVVKRISVRATEIQTFQHASVIIPNSELIAKAVKNWTYKDKFGRIDIPVGISYDSDPEKARSLLLDCVLCERRISSQPAPNVVFRNFGDNALEFELRCFVADIETYRAVASDLRFAILKAFRDNGIDMPYPQRVMHSPQLDRIAGLLERQYSEERV